MNSKQKQSQVFTKANQYAHSMYQLCKQLPSDEKYGLVSQLRRASLSVPTNIVEGYARKSPRYYKQFLLNSYGSLKEAQYLLQFAAEESLIQKTKARNVYKIGDEIGAMLWRKIETLESK